MICFKKQSEELSDPGLKWGSQGHFIISIIDPTVATIKLKGKDLTSLVILEKYSVFFEQFPVQTPITDLRPLPFFLLLGPLGSLLNMLFLIALC